LVLSPKARKVTRKLLVKGVGAALALGDQVKGLTTDVRKQLSTMIDESKVDKERMMITDLAEAMNEGVEEGIEKTKQADGKVKQTFSYLFKENDPIENSQKLRAFNVLNDQFVKNKLHEMEQPLQ
jgi:flagellar biosynthesis component FlhA